MTGRTRQAAASTGSGSGIDPLGLLSALVLDTGAQWGEAAASWQRADAAASAPRPRPGCIS